MSLSDALPLPKTWKADIDEIRPQYVLDAPDANALFASDIVRGNGASIAETINQLENAAITDLNSKWALALPSYSDQVLPFNVTLAGANEYGAMCASKILGIEILNEGAGISVDDAVTESQATFVARAIEPLQAVVSPLHQVPPFRLAQKTRARASGQALSPPYAALPRCAPLYSPFSARVASLRRTHALAGAHNRLWLALLYPAWRGSVPELPAGFDLSGKTLTQGANCMFLA